MTVGMEELFPAAAVASPSPRLKWLEKHGLILRKLENGTWICVLDDTNQGQGATEDEAAVDFCVKHHLKHWSEQ